MTRNYESKDIVVLEGLDAVRLRPGMYIGTTGVKGMHHLLWEIVDNAIDEATNGFGNEIIVTLHNDNSASVRDFGRGIPVDIHPTLKVSGVEVVFTQLHAGGKFNNENYSFSGGLHGVGASVTNALSEWTKVTVNKNGKQYYTEFASIEDASGKVHSGKTVVPLNQIGLSNDNGSYVRFLPDRKVFLDAVWDNNIVAKRLRELAFLNKGLKLVLIDERDSAEKSNKEFLFKGGLSDFVVYLNEEKDVLYSKPIYLEASSETVKLALSIQHTTSYSESTFSYVNNIPTSEGGTHETGLRTAITKMLNEYARGKGYLKEKDANFAGDDFREGLTCVLSIKLKQVQFEGQTKTKLGNPEVKQEVENLVYNELIKLSSLSTSAEIFDKIIDKAKIAAKARLDAKKAKELSRAKNSLDVSSLVGKLSSCTGRKPENNELFIVEGDSAGGSAKQARDRSFQAILPLKGKPLNVEKKRIEQVLANDEIRSIITALNTGIVSDFDISQLKYHKIIILSDADQDGAHIRAILLAFFYRYMKELVLNGNIYIGLPPLYKVYKKDIIKYVYSDYELDEAINSVGRGYMIQRYKGLGEMNPEQLWETTMDPKSRTLIRVTLEDAAECDKIMSTLMGDKIESRKEYILTHCDFNKVDNFDAMNI